MLDSVIKRRQAALMALMLAGFFGAIGEAKSTNTVYSCTFGTNGWSRDAWTMVDRPDMKLGGGWVQGADYIENDNPEIASMVYQRKLHGNVSVSCTLSFLDRMAPSVVLATRLMEAPNHRPVYQEHFEIVLWEQGINIWHHVLQDGKSIWTKTAFCTFPLKKNEKYQLQVKKTGKVMGQSRVGTGSSSAANSDGG